MTLSSSAEHLPFTHSFLNINCDFNSLKKMMFLKLLFVADNQMQLEIPQKAHSHVYLTQVFHFYQAVEQDVHS